MQSPQDRLYIRSSDPLPNAGEAKILIINIKEGKDAQVVNFNLLGLFCSSKCEVFLPNSVHSATK